MSRTLTIQQGVPLTVMQAVAIACRTKQADYPMAFIVRNSANGKAEVIRINLLRVRAHEEPDVTLLAGDILHILSPPKIQDTPLPPKMRDVPPMNPVRKTTAVEG